MGLLIASIAIACFALAGHALDYKRIAAWANGQEMRPLTACAMILLAIQGIAIAKRLDRMASLAGMIVIVGLPIALAIRNPPQPPSIGTVLCIFLAAAYGLLASVRATDDTSDAFVGGVMVSVSSVALAGYLFDVPQLYWAFRHSNGMSLNAATCIALTGLAFTIRTPKRTDTIPPEKQQSMASTEVSEREEARRIAVENNLEERHVSRVISRIRKPCL